METLHVEEPSRAESSEEDDGTGRERGHWANQLDYLMSILGSIVGYGNLWRFPYLCNRNGGGAFLIPFLFFLVTCGLPLFFLEVSVGQFAGKSNAHIWSVCPLLQGIGVGQFIVCSLTLIYYQNIIGWSLYYMGMSCSSILPWTSCSNSWNTEFCSDAAGTWLDPVWLEALIQVFYSLSTGWGVLVTLSSYNRFHDNSLRNSIVSTFAGEGTSLFCGLVIFTVLGSMAQRAGVGVSEVASSGPGLGFVVYPEGLSELPLPQLWAFLFFFMMVTVGLDSQFTWAETLITNVLDQFPRQLRKRRILVTGILCMVWFLMGLPITTQGGIYYFQILDWYTGLISIVTFAVLECVTFVWIYGVDRLGDDVELMLGRRVPLVFNILLGYITPIMLSTALLLVLVYFKPPTYGEYEYPASCRIVGWIIACLPVIPIPVMAALAIYRGKGTFRQRVSAAMKPAASWKPVEAKYHQLYCNKSSSRTKFSCLNPCRQ